jgi:hypothetical protein
MGIDSDIIAKAKLTFSSTHGIFHTQVPPIVGASAYIEDSLTRVLWNPGPDSNFQYSGVAFFDMWLKPFQDHMAYCSTTDCVSTFDAPENVPREKAATQLARVIAGKRASSNSGEIIPKYTESMDFNDNGQFVRA